MNILDNLSWALMTLEDELKFGLPEEIAYKRREQRVMGVLRDVIKRLKKEGEVSKIIEEYLTESDISDIVENADYHSRIIVAILDSAGKLKKENL